MALKRDLNLDLARSTAVVFVLFLHFVMGSGWYALPNVGFSAWVMNLCRSLFITCVPLFLLLSGYLCNSKRLSARYYLGLVRIYVIYLLSCAVSLLVRGLVLKEALDLRTIVGGIFNHSANEYSWYVSMYTGLFLMIPFLNTAYHGLPGRREKLVLVWTMVYLTAVPSLLNVGVSLYYIWWMHLYPLAYYFIGAFLSEYRPHIRPRTLLLLLAAALLAAGSLNYVASHPNPFHWADYSWYDGFETMGISVLVFLLLLNLDLSRCPKKAAACITGLSRLSFSVYLFSNVTDMLFYRVGQALIPGGYPWLWAYLFCALASLVGSVLLAWVFEKLARPIVQWICSFLTDVYHALCKA